MVMTMLKILMDYNILQPKKQSPSKKEHEGNVYYRG
jgi:hypothetical protein